jgi:hypothetical protein
MPDFSSKACSCMHNEFEMCFPSHTPNQTEIMDQLSKDNEHFLHNYVNSKDESEEMIIPRSHESSKISLNTSEVDRLSII